ATLPALAAASRRHRSLAEAARSLLPSQAPGSGGTRAGGPVFTTLTGGLGMLPDYLAKISGAEVHTGSMARELRPAGRGWQLRVGGRAVKAVTFSTVKWPHLAASPPSGDGDAALEIVRCSVGRIGEEALLQRADEELAVLAAAELAAATGVRGARAATRVTRW